MTKKSYLLIFVIVVAIFASYHYLNPMNSDYTPLDILDYHLETSNIERDNPLSAFQDVKNGQFYIHPGEKRESIGILSFYRGNKLKFYFSIDKGSKTGDIAFTVKKNGITLDRLIVTSKQARQIILDVDS